MFAISLDHRYREPCIVNCIVSCVTLRFPAWELVSACLLQDFILKEKLSPLLFLCLCRPAATGFFVATATGFSTGSTAVQTDEGKLWMPFLPCSLPCFYLEMDSLLIWIFLSKWTADAFCHFSRTWWGRRSTSGMPKAWTPWSQLPSLAYLLKSPRFWKCFHEKICSCSSSCDLSNPLCVCIQTTASLHIISIILLSISYRSFSSLMIVFLLLLRHVTPACASLMSAGQSCVCGCCCFRRGCFLKSWWCSLVSQQSWTS